MERVIKYFSSHLVYTVMIHFLGGVGVGLLIASQFGENTVTWGLILIGVAIIGHVYGWYAAKR